MHANHATLAALVLGLLWPSVPAPTAAAVELVEVIRPAVIVDGDTLRLDGVTIRLLDIDAPESFRSRCEAELVLALKAKERLRELIDAGPLTYTAEGRDRYGRTLARVYGNGRDVGAALLAEGLALMWRPGPAAKAERLAVWCGR